MRRLFKISTFVLVLCSLFSFSFNAHDVRSAKATKGEGNENWGLIGSFSQLSNGNRTEWDKDIYDDIPFHYVANEDPELAHYELLYTFKSGDEFKIRLDNKWQSEGGAEIGYGGHEGGNISTYLSNNGGNFQVKEDGTYLLRIKDDNVANYGDKSYGFSIEKITTASFNAGKLVFKDIYTNETVDLSTKIKSILITNNSDRLINILRNVYKVVGVDDSHDNYLRAYVSFTGTENVFDCVIFADVDKITANSDCSYMFEGFSKCTSIEFDNVDTSNVTNMSHMFENTRIKSIDLSSLNTSNVTDMSYMLANTQIENANLSNFSTSKVEDMSFMFSNTNNLRELDLSSFDTSKVTNMESMFLNTSELSALDLSNFDTSNVTNMNAMFKGFGEGLYNDDLTSTINVSSFNTEKVTDMSSMFEDCSSLVSLDVSNFNTLNVTNMSKMFQRCYGLTELKFYDNPETNTFVTTKVTDMSGMFNVCWSLTTLDVSLFDTSNVTNMDSMFKQCEKVTSLNLSKFNTENVTNMANMFSMCYALTSLNLQSFDTSKVTTMDAMFLGCSGLTSLDLSSFNTSNVTSMMGMFMGANKLRYLDLSSFNTSNVENMSFMFAYCTELQQVDISSFDLSKIPLETPNPYPNAEPAIVNGAYNMFLENPNLQIIFSPATMKEGLSIELPTLFQGVEGGVQALSTDTEGYVLMPGSLDLIKLGNALYALDTCTEYNQAPQLRAAYDALTAEDQQKFASLKIPDQDKDGNNVNVSAMDKLEYIEYLYALNNVTAKTEAHMMTSINDSSSFLVVAIAMSSLAILGYYLMQKRKYAR